MPIREHTHTLHFPKATKEMVKDGDDEEHIVVPASLGSAAAYDQDAFATAEQGRKADEAHDKSQKAHDKSHEAHESSQDATKIATAASETAKEANEKADKALQQSAKAEVQSEKALDFAKGAEEFAHAAKYVAEGIEEKYIEVEHLVNTFADKADKALLKTEVGALAKKDMVGLTDLDITGTKDADHVLSGVGWISVSDSRFGDMSGSVYDPNSIKSDVFDMDNMVEGKTHLILKESERDEIATISGLRTQIAGFTGQIESARSEAESAAESAKSAAAATSARADEFGRQLESVQEKLTSTTEQFSQEKARLTDSIEKIDTATSTANEAKQVVDDLKDSVDEVKRCCDTVKDEVKEARKDATDAKNTANSLDAKLTALETANVDLGKAQEAMKGITDKISATEATAEAAKDKAEDNARAVESMKADVQANKQSSQKNEDDIQKLRTEYDAKVQKDDATAAKVDKSANEIAANKDSIDTLKTTVTANSNKLASVETMAKEASDDVKEVKAAVQKAQQCCDEHKQQFVEIGNKADTAKTTSEENSSKLLQLQNKQTTLEGELDTVKASAAKANNDAQTAQQCCEQLGRKVTNIETKADQAVTDVAQAKATAQEANTTAEQALAEAKKAKPAAAGGDPRWKEVFDATGIGSEDDSAFHKILNTAYTQNPYTTFFQQNKGLAGFDYDYNKISNHFTDTWRNKVDQVNWLTSPAALTRQVVDTTYATYKNTIKLTELDSIMRNSRLMVMAKETPYIVPHATNKRKLTVKAGTTFLLPSKERKELPKYVSLNFNREVSHGLGATTAGLFNAGADHYVWLLLDWDRKPTPEVTIIMSNSKARPRGYNEDDSLLIGGFHTLCADVGVIAQHPLSGYKTGDILPASVWCLNHRPISDPEGMVYEPSHDIWCDIYLQSGTRASTVSKYNGVIAQKKRSDYMVDLGLKQKRLPTNSEFSALAYGITSGIKLGSAPSGRQTGGHRSSGSYPVRLISHIGCEDAVGVYWQYFSDVVAYYASNKYVYAALVGGGHYASSVTGAFAMFVITDWAKANTSAAARGVSGNIRFH